MTDPTSPDPDPASREPTAQPPHGQPPGYGPGPYGPPAYRPPPNAADSRNWAMGAHLSALATFVGVPSFVGPLVVWLLRRNDDPFAGEHGREALNFNLSVLLYIAVGVVLGFVLGILTLGIGFLVLIPVALVGWVLWLVFTIQGAMAGSRGERYRYPLCIRFLQ